MARTEANMGAATTLLDDGQTATHGKGSDPFVNGLVFRNWTTRPKDAWLPVAPGSQVTTKAPRVAENSMAPVTVAHRSYVRRFAVRQETDAAEGVLRRAA